MKEQEKPTGRKIYKNMTKQISSCCIDIEILKMLLLAYETDNTVLAAEAMQSLKTVMAKQGY